MNLQIPPSSRPTTRISLVSVSQLAMLASQKWAVKNVIPADGLIVVYAPPASGKTFFIVDCGLRIAHGLEAFGRSVKPGAVIFVAGEGLSGLKKRIKAWYQSSGLGMEGVSAYVYPTALNLMDESQVLAFINQAKQVQCAPADGPLLIVIDTLSRCFGDGDENSQRDMNQAVRSCDLLRTALGCSVCVVHHTGKNQNGPRGSTALSGAADTIIEVRRAAFGLEVTIEKQKDADSGQVYGFNLEKVDLGFDEDDESVSSPDYS